MSPEVKLHLTSKLCPQEMAKMTKMEKPALANVFIKMGHKLSGCYRSRIFLCYCPKANEMNALRYALR